MLIFNIIVFIKNPEKLLKETNKNMGFVVLIKFCSNLFCFYHSSIKPDEKFVRQEFLSDENFVLRKFCLKKISV